MVVGVPFEYLSNDQEAESNGENSPEILCFRKDFAIMVLQIRPAVALRKPNPVRPYQLTQLRQHPKDEMERKRNLRVCCTSWKEIETDINKTVLSAG